MPSSPPDARVVKSGRALHSAMLALIERKPLEQITIREIAREAGVHYATFFRHHPSKEALLDHIAADQIDHLVDLTLPVFNRANFDAAVLALCTYVESHRRLWTVLLTGGAAGAMRTELLRISRQVAMERDPVGGWLPVELGIGCSVSLIFETLAWWLAQDPAAVKVERVASILAGLLTSMERR